VSVPLRLGPSDPTIVGAVLRVSNAAGLASDDVRVTLPAERWSAIGTRRLRGWRYRAARGSGEAVRRVVVMKDTLQIDVRGIAWTYTLDEAQQGSVAVVVRLGATRFCAAAVAKTSARNADRPGRFVGEPHAPAPPSCPAEP
jgi:hypothetical protein